MNTSFAPNMTEGTTTPSLPPMAWAVAAAATNAVLAQVVFMAVILGASVVVWGLELDQRAGSAVYVVAIALLVVAHAAAIHVGVRFLGTHARVPAAIWLGLLVYPVAMVAVSLLSAGAVEAFPGMVATASVALAFVTLGRRRWSA